MLMTQQFSSHKKIVACIKRIFIKVGLIKYRWSYVKKTDRTTSAVASANDLSERAVKKGRPEREKLKDATSS